MRLDFLVLHVVDCNFQLHLHPATYVPSLRLCFESKLGKQAQCKVKRHGLLIYCITRIASSCLLQRIYSKYNCCHKLEDLATLTSHFCLSPAGIQPVHEAAYETESIAIKCIPVWNRRAVFNYCPSTLNGFGM